MPDFDPKKLEQTPIEKPNPTERRPEGSVEYSSEHEDMINELRAMRAGRYNFLESIVEWGEEKGWLTEAQDRKLREIYDGY